MPKLDIPHIVHGDNGQGVGRGKGKDGDIIKKGNKDGQGQGNQAGQEAQEGIIISVELEEILKWLQEDLALPDLKPKPNETFEEEEIKYTSISLTGPESLRHNRRTMLQAMKRHAAMGDLNKMRKPPGFAIPIRMISMINSDRRYRQYKIVKKPSSNAVIFFARDGSGSMDQFKCDIISDMCWWIDIWIRRFYKRVERCYVWHDVNAQEVDEHTFYRYRGGGGTTCSSALKLIARQFENRFPPNKWNFYIFYFTDGENDSRDNKIFVETIREQLPPDVVNFVGITQVLAYSPQGSLKEIVDNKLNGIENIRTTEITPEAQSSNGWGYYSNPLSDEQRDQKVRQAIIDLLGTKKKAPTLVGKNQSN